MMAFAFALCLIPSSICIAAAGYMAVHGIDGWGWFLFVGLLLGGYSYTTNKTDE